MIKSKETIDIWLCILLQSYESKGNGLLRKMRLTTHCTRPIYPLRFGPLRCASGREAPRVNGRVNVGLCAEEEVAQEKIELWIKVNKQI
mgnify:CR=1 FL=1